MRQLSSRPLCLTVFIACLGLFFSPPLDAAAQYSWDDRSDEAFDQVDSGSSATWIMLGAGVGLATAAIVYTVRKRRAEQQDSEEASEETEEDNPTSALRTLSPETGRLQQLTDVQRRMPVNVLLGVRPSDQRPVVGFAIRF
jgi:hypothetical protein